MTIRSFENERIIRCKRALLEDPEQTYIRPHDVSDNPHPDFSACPPSQKSSAPKFSLILVLFELAEPRRVVENVGRECRRM